MDVERGQPDRETADRPLGSPLGLAADDRADVRRGAAHVERDRVLDTGETRDTGRADDARGRPGQERPRGVGRRLGERDETARRAHHERLRQAGAGARAPERAEIAGEERTEVRVRRRGRGTLVLAELGRDLVRGDDVSGRVAPPQLVGDGELVSGVAEREEQADRDRLGVELGQRAQVERLEHALGPDPLSHAVTALERDERLGVLGAQPVEVRPRLPAQVQEVLEAGRGHERGPRALALEERVRRDRRPVAEALDTRRTDRPRGREHRFLLPRRRRHLRGPHDARRAAARRP